MQSQAARRENSCSGPPVGLGKHVSEGKDEVVQVPMIVELTLFQTNTHKNRDPAARPTLCEGKPVRDHVRDSHQNLILFWLLC